MKKLLIAALLCIAAFSTKAQSFYNFTGCTYRVMQVCFGTGCARTITQFTVPPFATIPAPPGCVGEIGYEVCTSCGACVYINATIPYSNVCCPWPAAAVLPACAPCGPANVQVDGLGNVRIF